MKSRLLLLILNVYICEIYKIAIYLYIQKYKEETLFENKLDIYYVFNILAQSLSASKSNFEYEYDNSI